MGFFLLPQMRPKGKSPLAPTSNKSAFDDPPGRPLRYTLASHVQVCTHCNSYHTTNQNNLVLQGPRHLHIRPVTRFEYNLPVEIIQQETEWVPACRLCNTSVDLSHLPPPQAPTPRQAARAGWKNAPTNSKSKSPAKPITSDDLVF